MKIFYITEGYLDRKNGTTSHIKGFIEGMRTAGLDVLSFLRRDDSTGSVEIPEVNIALLGTLLSQKKMLDAVMSAAKNSKPALIFGRVEYQSIAPWLAARRLRVPLVADLNGDLEFQMRERSFRERVLSRYTEYNFLKSASRIIVTSAAMAERVGKRLAISLDKFRVLPMGVADNFFGALTDRDEARKILNIPQNIYSILFVGHLNEWQGVEELIRLAKSFKDCELWIAGEGSSKNKFEIMARGLPVRFLGAFEPEKMPLLLSSADILIQPPRREEHVGMPTRMAEYLASGKPVIASDRHRTENEFARQGLIFTADFKKPEDVMSLLGRIRKDISSFAPMLLDAQEYAKNYLRWSSIGKSLFEIFEEVRNDYSD